MLILIALLLFLLVIAATWWFGFWSNVITLVNLLLAAMIASSFYETAANQIINFNRSFALLADFIAVWVVFVLSFIVLRTLTDSLSAYRLKFDLVTEMVGRSILSIWVAVVFVCFSFFTLQMAPLTPDFFGDKQQKAGQLPGTIADRAWLSFVQSRSRGALSSSKEANFMVPVYELKTHPDDEDLNARVFDPFGRFLTTAQIRRFIISTKKTLRVSQ